MKSKLLSNEDINKILYFLINAKKKTYAGGNSARVFSSRLGSKDYEYEEMIDTLKFRYHDTYFGGEKFIGCEIVYIDEIPVWGMNYNGYSVIKDLSEEAIDRILRPALMKVGEDNSILPLRGPREFTEGVYKYTFNQSGTMENFIGIERIYKNEILIYELHCSGGIIK